jgi:hypothetical protein
MKATRILTLLAIAIATVFASIPSHAAASDPFVVSDDPIGDGAVDGQVGAGPLAGSAAGLDMTLITIAEPTASTLEFVINVTDMQLSPTPNEVVRYLWMMQVNGKEYWIQAKQSDITTASATADDAQGTAEHLTGAFRLRGNCSVTGVVSTCHHIKWLQGAFDAANKQVRMTVPLEDAAAPDFTAGASIVTVEVDSSLQVAISNASTSDQILGGEEYTIP